MRRSLFAACILAVPFVAHSQSRCAIPAKVDPAVHLPSPINVTGHPVGVFQKRRFLLDDRRTESFRLFIGLNNYRLKTVRPCERL
jgi:hypothetical protein